MKTTLDIDDQLLADAKLLAVRQRTTLTRLIEQGLQLRLRTLHASQASPKLYLPTFEGKGGLVKGIDPSSNRSMMAALNDDA